MEEISKCSKLGITWIITEIDEIYEDEIEPSENTIYNQNHE